MLDCSLWRLEATALPAWITACPRCARSRAFRCAERFRVNASGARLDVWLLYRCPDCGLAHKRSLLRRTPVARLAPGSLEAYQADAPERVRAAAFAFGVGAEELPYRVLRPPLPARGGLAARIEAPEPVGVRWDLFLARELAWSRSRVARAFASGAARLSRGGPRACVRDGDELRLDLSNA